VPDAGVQGDIVRRPDHNRMELVAGSLALAVKS
jgi:hypothetical protein